MIFNNPTIIQTLKMPSKGIKYAVINKAPIAEPSISELYIFAVFTAIFFVIAIDMQEVIADGIKFPFVIMVGIWYLLFYVFHITYKLKKIRRRR